MIHWISTHSYCGVMVRALSLVQVYAEQPVEWFQDIRRAWQLIVILMEYP